MGFTAEVGANEFFVVVNIRKDCDVDACKDRIYELVKLFHKSISDGMKCTFTIGVSSFNPGLKGLQQAYMQGWTAVNYRMSLGHGNVIYYEKMLLKENSRFQYPFQLKRIYSTA